MKISLLFLVLCGEVVGQTRQPAGTWEKRKECAAQSEKYIADYNSELVAAGFKPAIEWSNHYSPKYDRCFVRIKTILGDGKRTPLFFIELRDAFERSMLASFGEGGPTALFCKIDDAEVDCSKAKTFISEHMKY